MRPTTPSRPESRPTPRPDRPGPNAATGLFLIATLAALLAGCSQDGGPGADTIDADVAKARQTWKLTLEGAQSELPLETMDIFLVDDDEQWPEIFEITGPEVTIVGAFPMDVHVGYETAFEKLMGKSITIDPRGGDPRDPKFSRVLIDGAELPVLGGKITFERATGKWEGTEGDQTLWGRVELRVPGVSGERTVHGSFAVHAVTWG